MNRIVVDDPIVDKQVDDQQLLDYIADVCAIYATGEIVDGDYSLEKALRDKMEEVIAKHVRRGINLYVGSTVTNESNTK